MSASMPTSATWKMGALTFLLMATINGAPLMPPMCWKGAADTAGQVDLGLDRLAGGTHLAGFLQPLGIHDGTRAGDHGAHGIGQFLGNLDILLVFDAAAHGNQDVGLGDVHIADFGFHDFQKGAFGSQVAGIGRFVHHRCRRRICSHPGRRRRDEG
jgi:hypothetical protein